MLKLLYKSCPAVKSIFSNIHYPKPKRTLIYQYQRHKPPTPRISTQNFPLNSSLNQDEDKYEKDSIIVSSKEMSNIKSEVRNLKRPTDSHRILGNRHKTDKAGNEKYFNGARKMNRRVQKREREKKKSKSNSSVSTIRHAFYVFIYLLIWRFLRQISKRILIKICDGLSRIIIKIWRIGYWVKAPIQIHFSFRSYL